MKALISPEEKVTHEGKIMGSRIAQISEQEFEVASPLFWVDCDKTIPTSLLYWDGNEIQVIPHEPLIPIDPALLPKSP